MHLLDPYWLRDIQHRTLSPREAEIVQHLASGETPKEIAAACRIAIKTVEAHCKHIREKWQLSNQRELYQHAYVYVHADIGRAARGDAAWVLEPRHGCSA